MSGAEIAQGLAALTGLGTIIVGLRGVPRARTNRRRAEAEADRAEAEAKKATVDAAIAPIQATVTAQGELIDDLNQRVDELNRQLRQEREDCDRALAGHRDELERLKARVERASQR